MSDPDPDQESYSIDEMLSRLRSRNRGPSDGEAQLVTRADGSQAVKVRRRKRRSHQPHKEAEKRRRRRHLLVASLVVGIVLALILGGAGWLFYLNSSSYQADVESRIETWTGAEVDITRFRATPVGVGADQVEAVWPESSPAARLKLSQVRGDLTLSSHLGGEWTGQGIRAGAGDLVLRRAAPRPDDAPSLPDGTLPFQVPLEVGAMSVRFGEGERPALHLGAAKASFRVPNPEVKAGSLVLEDGRFRLGNWGAFNLEFASIHLSREGVKVGNLRFHPEGDEQAGIHLSGQELSPILVRGEESELRASVEDIPSVTLLGSGLGRLVDARFTSVAEEMGESRCHFDVTDLSTIRLVVPVEAKPGTRLHLRKLPLFERLAKELGDPRFPQPGFDAATRVLVRRDATGCRIEGLHLSSRDGLEVSGTLAESNNQLEGVLEIGLPESLVMATPSVAGVFRRAASGMRWATVRVSGTVQEPKDDFADQLANAGTDAVEDDFLELTTPREER